MELRGLALLLWFCCMLLHCTTVVDSTTDIVAPNGEPSAGGPSIEVDPDSGGSGSGAWESLSGSGSGSGDDQGRGGEGEIGEGGGEDAAGGVAACPEALRAGDGEVEAITSSTAYTAVSCHLSCMEEVVNSSEFPNARFQAGNISGVWPYLVFPEFDRENKQSTCPAYKKFRECLRGCLVRTQQNKTTLRRNQCKRDCRDECLDVRIKDNYYNPYCEVDCSAPNCVLGCNRYTNIQRSQNTSATPHGPVAPPVLLSQESVLFQVNLTNSAPATDTLSPVGFVYRIKDQLTGATVFLSQVSVSFVAVNKYGASTESPAATIIVPGPLNPPTIQGISTAVDTRLGFFGYGVVTITWQHPQSSVHIDHYVVKVFSLSGDRNNHSSDHLLTSTTSLTMKAEVKDSLFLLGNRYVFQTPFNICAEENMYINRCVQSPKKMRSAQTELTNCSQVQSVLVLFCILLLADALWVGRDDHFFTPQSTSVLCVTSHL